MWVKNTDTLKLMIKRRLIIIKFKLECLIEDEYNIEEIVADNTKIMFHPSVTTNVLILCTLIMYKYMLIVKGDHSL